MNKLLLLVAIFALLNASSQAANDKLGATEARSGLLRQRKEMFHVESSMTKNANDKETPPHESNNHRQDRELKSSKGSKSCKSGKSSKHGSCDDDDDDDDDRVTNQSCDGLGNLAFDLGTRVQDVGIETLRFRTLGDNLQTTRILAAGGAKGDTVVSSRRAEDDQDLFAFLLLGQERKLQNGDDVEANVEALEQSLRDLERLVGLLSTENERVEEVNFALHQSAIEWILLNTNLTHTNTELLTEVLSLSEENAALLSERSALNVQIGELEDHIGNLNGLIDDHADLNGQLNASTLELMEQIARLEEANAEYASLNDELSNHLDDLESQNMELAEQNSILAGLNQDLNVTSQNLEEHVDLLEGEVDELERLISDYNRTIDDLRNQTDRLEQANDELEETIEDLEVQVDSFANKTAELEGINQGLETIVSFLNETAGDLDDTYDALTEYLAQQIDAYRTIAVETLNNVYMQRTDLWDCNYRTFFGDEPFASDEDLEIPDTKLGAVMEYVDNRVLKQICLTKIDFEHYLEATFPNDTYTTSHFVSGISSYTTLALDYYFPDTGEVGGLTSEDWALAQFACENLPNDKRFLMSHN